MCGQTQSVCTMFTNRNMLGICFASAQNENNGGRCTNRELFSLTTWLF